MSFTNQYFYGKQVAWFPKLYFGEVNDEIRHKVSVIKKYMSNDGEILDLGTGGGQNALAMAELGYNVLGIELLSELAAYAKKNATKSKGRLVIVKGDFYKIKLNKKFQLITYWDGFGVGNDEEQKLLLKKINSWLKPNGSVLVEVYTPWYREYFFNKEISHGKYKRKFSFDYVNCRWEDTWWHKRDISKKIKQSLRCYSPADLKLLLNDTGLALKNIIPCVGIEKKNELLLYGKKDYLDRAITYLAQIEKED